MLVREKLHRTDPYAEFPIAFMNVDKQGWGYEDRVFEIALSATRPHTIIEVGTWKGMSAIVMGRIVRSLGLDCEIVCVDTWLGSPEHVTAQDESWYQSLRFRYGYPSIYYTFLSNILHEGLSDIITPFPATSENAAHILTKWQVRPDILYIDAAHEYESVLRDMRLLSPLLSDKGIMIMDDYNVWPGVSKGVDEFIEMHKLHDSSLKMQGKAVIALTQSASFEELRKAYVA
jgi:hypothetical protein